MWVRRLTFLLIAATPQAAFAAPLSLPTPLDVATAYTEAVNETCRQLIDQCEGVPPVTPAEIEGLSCRLRSRQAATCRFVAQARHCSARFTRRSSDAAWQARDFSRSPRVLRVRCAGFEL